ncbi:MAG TPA: hypothetical protein VLH56_11780 [Dissulfurispiraceae bacterium]|nr:hypothetical protein [Dissulfurispiraceae bacterium]
MKITVTFDEPLLGTLAGDPELAREFIASKAPNGGNGDEAEAIENLDESLVKGSTVFPRTADDCPFLWDYQVKGFFKEACRAMIDMEVLTQAELKAARLTAYLYKKTIDNLIFVGPRRIPLMLPAGGIMGWCERPLRGETMRGERIALARSEEAPAGTTIQFEVISMNKALLPYILRWLEYGKLKGLGQWRNSGKGRFSFSVIAD